MTLEQDEPVADACADERRLVTERGAVTEAASQEERRVQDALLEAQREYDVTRERVERARMVADPRQVAEEKTRLHATFGRLSDVAADPEVAEAAARDWLADINRLNARVLEAQAAAERGAAELEAMLPVLDRWGREAEAARFAAASAQAGWQAAREALATCEERVLSAAITSPAEEPAPMGPAMPVETPPSPAEAPRQAAMPPPRAHHPADASLDGLPIVVRALRGDLAARDWLVATLAGPDPDGAAAWGARLAALFDAIVGRAIEDGYLELPEDGPFWGRFSAEENREIVAALSALGFRFDGFGGFADERLPTPRDLSLAVGYAGIDRMRVRTWPRDAEIGALFAHATVAADQWLSANADDLALGSMVDALGSRAGNLAEVWNAWGRVRPALLER